VIRPSAISVADQAQLAATTHSPNNRTSDRLPDRHRAIGGRGHLRQSPAAGVLVVPRRRMSDAERQRLPIRIRFHDLRHTHASQLLAAGVNVKVVSERLGHASVAFTLDTYAHLMPGQQAQAAAAAAALVDGS
jgi:integrase